MKLIWTAVAALLVILAVPGVGLAHGGHTHKVMGTVSTIDGTHVMVKTSDGKTVMVMMDDKTKITRGKAKATAADVKVGERIVAEGAENRDTITATVVRLATAPAKK